MSGSRKTPPRRRNVRGHGTKESKLPVQSAEYDPGDRPQEVMARFWAQHERTERALARLEESRRRREELDDLGGGVERPDEQVPDALEELWALDLDAPLDAYLDRRT